jgi:LuxR family maltose regulon positive regulatory protein
LHQAAEYYRQALAKAREQKDHKQAANALLGLGRLAFEWNDLTTAAQQVQEALALIDQQEPRLSNQALFQLALLDHAQGQTAAAQQQLATLLARLQMLPAPWDLLLYLDILIWQARLQLASGDLQGAQRSLETALLNFPFYSPSSHNYPQNYPARG